MNTNKQLPINMILTVLKSRWYICLASIILCFSFALYYVSFHMEPVYSARTTIFISNDTPDATRTTATNIAISEKLKADCQVLATSSRVLDVVRQNLPDEINVNPSNIVVSLIEDSRIVKLTVTDANPVHAARIANTLTDTLIVAANEILKIENMQPVDRAVVPKVPNPGRSRNYLVVSIVIGAVLGFGLILLIETFDKRLHGPEDITLLYDLPVLALIPKITEADVLEEDGELS